MKKRIFDYLVTKPVPIEDMPQDCALLELSNPNSIIFHALDMSGEYDYVAIAIEYKTNKAHLRHAYHTNYSYMIDLDHKDIASIKYYLMHWLTEAFFQQA